MLGVSVCAADSTAPAKVNAVDPSPDYTVRHVNIGRQATLEECDKSMRKGNEEFSKGNFELAREYYMKAADILKDYSGEVFVKRRKQCLRYIEECYTQAAEAAMIKADDSVSVGDFEQAIQLCRQAMEKCPSRKKEFEAKISFYEQRRDAAVTREKRNINVLTPGYANDNYKVDLLIERGRALVKREEYIKAKRCFEEVLLIDPYNYSAMQNMLGVNTLIQKAAKLRANATQQRATAMDKWAGAVPIAKEHNDDELENNISAPVEKIEISDDPVIAKLNSIKINKVDFEDIGFEELIDFMRGEARKADVSINFIVKPHANQDKEIRIPQLHKDNCSLYELLFDLQNVHKFLSFRSNRKALFIAAAGVPLEKNDVRIIEVSLPSQIKSDADLEEYIASHGIRFDKSLNQGVFRHRLDGFVLARHTPDNLDKIKQALDDLASDEPDMVQIMFKFLEVRQDDLDELAFSWQYARTGNNLAFTSGNSLLRHYSRGDGEDTPRYSGTATNENVQDANIYYTWQDQKNRLDFQLYALDWADNKSIL